MFNWDIKDKTTITAQNAIYLAETGDSNGRPFKSRFLQAGLVKYDFGVCLLKKETIDSFVNTFINQPVIIGHKDYIEEKDVVGYIHNIWFSPEDGWFWCDGKLTDEEAIRKIENGYNVSCQYRITEYINNEENRLHNGNPYDKEILKGVFEHLAIVECPRYEDAFIAVNALLSVNEDKWITIKPNGEEGKGRHLLLKDGETPAEAIQRVYGNKDQQTLFDTSGYKKTKEDYKKEKEDKQKEYDKIEENHKNIEKDKKDKKQSEIKKAAEELTLEKFLNKHLEDFDGSYSKAMDYWEKHSKDYHTTSDENIINKHFKKEYEHYKGEKEETKYLDELKKSMDNVDSLNYSFEDVKRINEYINEAESADYDDFVKAMRKKYERLPLETNEEYFERERKGKPFRDKGKSKLYEKMFTAEVEKELRESVKAQQYENKEAKVGDTVIDSDKILSKFSSKLSPEEYKFFDWEEAEEFLFDKLNKIERETFKKETASNSFVDVFRNMLYETLAEGIYERLGEYIAQNEERWITIHPHGEDSEDYRRLKLEDGESPKEAIDRVYKKEGKEESEKKKEDKKGLLKENAVEEKIEEARKKFDEQSQEYTKIVKEINDYENNVYKQMEKIEEIEERNKFFENYRKEHKEEEEKLIEKRNKAYENYLEAEKRYEKFKEELANEYLQIDVENLDKEEFDNFIHNLKRLKYISGIEYSTRQKIQAKIEETTTNKDKKEVKERADKIGGYTKKLNDLCGFTELSDISAFPETLQKHIYDNYKQVYDKYPQIKYGGIQKYHLSSNTYAQNTSVRNRVVLNSLFYDDLDKLKESYERTVKSQFHPQGTDYNSIIVHELGHALLEYITKKTGKTGAEIRDKVLKKLKIKQKDVKEHLSEYAMYKPRKAHEFFAEAFAEYMTSKSPRPLAVEFGKEINNILEVYKLN